MAAFVKNVEYLLKRLEASKEDLTEINFNPEELLKELHGQLKNIREKKDAKVAAYKATPKPSRKSPNKVLERIIEGEFKVLRRSLKRTPEYQEQIISQCQKKILTQLSGYEVVEVGAKR